MAAVSVTRLSGGNTPADGSDPRTFPAIWNSTASIIESGVGFTVVTSSTRPGAPFDGQGIYETDTGLSFVWDGSAWQGVGGGGGAGGAITLNTNEITADYTFDANTNGVSAGPITIASGVTVTVGATSAWSIV